MNKILITGRIVKDLTLEGSGDKKFLKFTVATVEKDAQFVPCVAFKKTAENLAKFCKKGALIGIEGAWQTTKHDGKFYNQCAVKLVEFLDTKGATESRDTDGYQNHYQGNDYDMSEEDVPF